MVKTPGQMAYGLQLLESCRGNLEDLGHGPVFRAMIEKAGLPYDLSRIDISGDRPDTFPRRPDVTVPQSTADDVLAGNYHSLATILVDGINIGDGGSSSTPIAPRRKNKKPSRFSHSRFLHPWGREEAN